eukprot:m.768198 g.768198  ORF g.768198 m.768198 type:complete len:122 (-) comp59074_c0_seq40:3473-3838(-)
MRRVAWPRVCSVRVLRGSVIQRQPEPPPSFSNSAGRSLPPPRTRKQTETSNIVTRAGDQRLQAAFEKHGIDDDVLFFADLAELASVDDVIAEHEDTLSGLLAASRPVPLSSAASSFLIASD